jgi:hypothetical protein
MTMQNSPDHSGWSHEQEMAWVNMENANESERLAADRAHELALLESNRGYETEKLRSADSIAEATSIFVMASKRSWRTSRIVLIFVIVGIWLGMIVATLGFSFLNDGVRDNLALYISLITIVSGVALPAAAILYLQGWQESQKEKENGGDPA